jgi:hypothetical protein
MKVYDRNRFRIQQEQVFHCEDGLVFIYIRKFGFWLKPSTSFVNIKKKEKKKSNSKPHWVPHCWAVMANQETKVSRRLRFRY